METSIRPIPATEFRRALPSARHVQEEFKAPGHSKEETTGFGAYIDHASILKQKNNGITPFVDHDEDENLVEVICARHVMHLDLLFIEKSHHRKGIARRWVLAGIKESPEKELPDTAITRNSSPYVINFYQKQGFTGLMKEQDTSSAYSIPISLAA